METSGLEFGLDQALRAHVEAHHVAEGQLFGMVAQNGLTSDERMALIAAGWTARNYQDRPMMEPPTLRVAWDDLRRRHRDLTLHRINHQLPGTTPWAGNRIQILEEMLASAWEAKEDEIRTLLNAWSYASVWTEPEDDGRTRSLEHRQTFFFYAERMKAAAERVLTEGVAAPEADDEFWTFVNALINQ